MNLEELAQALKDGKISLTEWQAAMREYLKQQYTVATMLAKGGAENVTPSDWGYMGSLLKKQYGYLDGFVQDIANNPKAWLTGRLDVRMNMYKESAYAAYEDINRREMTNVGMDEERRLLGEADHCPDCLYEFKRGWQPIGTLAAIGDSVCTTNCKCTFEYRKITMLFAPAQSTDMLFAPAIKKG